MTKLPKAGVDLIKRFEGCHLKAYPDPLTKGAPYTVGWGSTRKKDGSPFRLREEITQQQADELLEHQLLTAYLPAISKIPHFNEMSEEQVGALLSFAYNLGANFYGSRSFETLSRRLRNREWDLIPEALLLYRNAGTSVEVGLKRRRIAEGALWSSGTMKNKMVKTQIIALQNTTLKKKPLQSYQLSHNERKEVQKGKGYDVIDTTNEGIHSRVILDHNAGEWYIYNPHWSVSYTGEVRPNKSAPNSRILAVKYFSQRDSATMHAHRMCFSSTCAMAADYIKPGAIKVSEQEDDFYMKNYVMKYGDTTSAGAQISALKSLGIKATFRQDLDEKDIKSQIDKNIPVPVGLLHHGPLSAPTGGGHWMCIIGYNDNTSQYIVNDPYGELDMIGGGYYGSTNGAGVKYKYSDLHRRWMVGSRGVYAPGRGWGIIIEV